MDASGIAVADVRDEYRRRGVDGWSDVQLGAAVADVVSWPRQEPADSFVLHAPLELIARAALLRYVAGERRDLARLHILAIAARYEEVEPASDIRSEPEPLPDTADPVTWLADAIGAGDLVDADRAAVEIACRLRPDEVAGALVDVLAPLTSAAGHAPIFLYHHHRVAPRGELSTRLLRPVVRELARQPDWRLRWFDHRTATGATDDELLSAALCDVPLVGVPGSTFIHPLMMQLEESGFASEQLGPLLGRHDEVAARAVLRVAARSMLEDTAEHAPYGWTHCLTMPQAVLGLAPRSQRPERCLAIAATHVAAFRAGLGRSTLPARPAEAPAAPPDDLTDLVTAGATAHDAHVVKYTLACLDAAASDPPARALYLHAARRLLDVWDELGGDPTDPLAD